jgi:hypothetical protein
MHKLLTFALVYFYTFLFVIICCCMLVAQEGPKYVGYGRPTFFLTKGHTRYCRLVFGQQVQKMTVSGKNNCLNNCVIFTVNTYSRNVAAGRII